MSVKRGVPAILGCELPLAGYPENVHTDAIEQRISASLPVIHGLDRGDLSSEERASVLAVSVQAERAAFVAKFGDPFCCDVVVPVETQFIAEKTVVGA